MKKIGFYAMFALATLSVAPVMAADADEALAAVVALVDGAEVTSTQTFVDKVCAFLNSGVGADDFFAAVLASDDAKGWSADEVGTALTVVLNAHEQIGAELGEDSDWVSRADMNEMLLEKLKVAQGIDAEVKATVLRVLQPAVAETTASVVNTVDTGVSAPSAAARVRAAGTRPLPPSPGTLIPSPPAMSPQQ